MKGFFKNAVYHRLAYCSALKGTSDTRYKMDYMKCVVKVVKFIETENKSGG